MHILLAGVKNTEGIEPEASFVSFSADNETDRATIRPWYAKAQRDGLSSIYYNADNPSETPIIIAHDLRPARAALIVAAVNSHYAMLLLAEGVRRLGDKSARRGFKVTVDEVKGYARTALALARGK